MTEEFKMMKIKDLKNGDHFKFTPMEKDVYGRGEYDSASRKYYSYKLKDVCSGRLSLGVRRVFITKEEL